MSGSIGANRILREDVKPTVDNFENLVLNKFQGYKKLEITGSYNAGTKKDHGDIDICIWIESDKDIKEVKKEFKTYLENLSDDLTPRFRSGKNSGKKAQMYGNIVTCQFNINNSNDPVQIDCIIVLSPEELHFQKTFLNLDAQTQTFMTAIVRVAQDDVKQNAFKNFNITNIPYLNDNQELEFVLSMSGLSLRKVTLDENMKTLDKEEIWRTQKWDYVNWLVEETIDMSPIWKTYEELLDRASIIFKNDERSRKRMCGIMKSMINIGPGEIGTEKGMAKQKGIDLAFEKLNVNQ